MPCSRSASVFSHEATTSAGIWKVLPCPLSSTIGAFSRAFAWSATFWASGSATGTSMVSYVIVTLPLCPGFAMALATVSITLSTFGDLPPRPSTATKARALASYDAVDGTARSVSCTNLSVTNVLRASLLDLAFSGTFFLTNGLTSLMYSSAPLVWCLAASSSVTVLSTL